MNTNDYLYSISVLITIHTQWSSVARSKDYGDSIGVNINIVQ